MLFLRKMAQQCYPGAAQVGTRGGGFNRRHARRTGAGHVRMLHAVGRLTPLLDDAEPLGAVHGRPRPYRRRVISSGL
jgi:hypothetical protein